MTPSAWHNDAMSRDAGHDEMQFAFWQSLIEDGQNTIRVLRNKPDKDGNTSDEYARYNIQFEFEFIHRGKLLGFGDVVEQFWRKGDSTSSLPILYWRIYEIKPKVHSVGGVVRQARALKRISDAAMDKGNGHKSFESWVRVITVVPWDDPKIDMLRSVLGMDNVIGWQRSAS